MRAADGLPESGRLDLGAFARLFDQRTNSYKFFFFLALLDRIAGSDGASHPDLDRPIPVYELAVDMVLGAWYPHGFCRLSLGSQDQLQLAVDSIHWGPVRGSWIQANGVEWRRLRETCASQLHIEKFIRYVPFRLLRPFFAGEMRGIPDQQADKRLAELSVELFQERKPLYCFTADRSAIIVQHDWLEYLERNCSIVRAWARFHLVRYLQDRNPSIAGITEKLMPPLIRESLARQTAWWNSALPLLGGKARCIYSGGTLSVGEFSLDHFLPWSFVAHDQPWNLVPVTRSVNSAKSDKLPASHYLEELIGLHQAGFSATHATMPESRWTKAVEPWIQDLRLADKHVLLDLPKLRLAYSGLVLPQLRLAETMGFEANWEY